MFYTRSPEAFGYTKIPFIETELIRRLRELDAVSREGIFRLSGLNSSVYDLCHELNDGVDVDWEKYKDPNVVACTLKKYFRDSEPIISIELFNQMATALSNGDDKLGLMKELLGKLTLPRRLMLSYLMEYLREVINNKDVNKMGVSNLSIIFSACLIESRGTGVDALFNNQSQRMVMDFIIKNSQELFEPVPQSAIMTGDDIEFIKHEPYELDNPSNILKTMEFRRRSTITYVQSSVD